MKKNFMVIPALIAGTLSVLDAEARHPFFKGPLDDFFETACFATDYRLYRDLEKKVLVLEVDLPGWSKDEVEITYANGTLSVQGQKKKSEKKEGEKISGSFNSQTTFSKSFTLGSSIDEASIHAKMENGVLKIEMKELTDSKKTIKIQ